MFENRITLVNQMGFPDGRAATISCYVIHHEKSKNAITVKSTPELDAAFEARNWEAFEAAEAAELGGEVTHPTEEE
jgi:hypothetical protein